MATQEGANLLAPEYTKEHEEQLKALERIPQGLSAIKSAIEELKSQRGLLAQERNQFNEEIKEKEALIAYKEQKLQARIDEHLRHHQRMMQLLAEVYKHLDEVQGVLK